MSAFNWPTGVLETKLGKVTFARTQADHVSIRTESGEFVQVHGVFYHVHLNLFQGEGDSWAQKMDSRLYMERDWSGKHSNKPASMAARTTLVNELTRAWCEYAAAHPEDADLAQRAKLTRDLERADEEIEQLEAKLTDARKERATIKHDLRLIGGPVE